MATAYQRSPKMTVSSLLFFTIRPLSPTVRLSPAPLYLTLTENHIRHLPHLQIIPLSQPEHAVPCQSSMLPQDVRVLRRPHILPGPSPLPRGRLCAYDTEATIQEADI